MGSKVAPTERILNGTTKRKRTELRALGIVSISMKGGKQNGKTKCLADVTSCASYSFSFGQWIQ
jgi:hypothetical protein